MKSTAMARPSLSCAHQEVNHESTTSLMFALLLFFYPSSPHRGAAFEPLQMLPRARKSMHSNRDKRDLVLDNSRCLSVHYSLDRRDIDAAEV